MQDLWHLVNETGLSPHGFCLLWDPALMWLHAASDTVIGLSYYAIPVALAWFVAKRDDLAFSWIFLMFAAFILLCGTTHFFEVWVLWNPSYGLQGLVKAATALASAATAVSLWWLMPKALALPSPVQLRRANDELSIQIREREKATAALRESTERYRLLVDGIQDYAIYMLDADGVITNWNSGAERIKGYTADEVIGRPFSIFHTKEDQAAGVPAKALAVAAREGKYESEAWRVRKDGSRFWASVIVDALRNDKGELIGFAKITRDITQRLQQEQALEQARTLLAQSQKMEAVGQLTGGVAHDFNNLLTTILGNVDLVERRIGQADADTRRLLAGAKRAAERGASLTQRLLAFARRQALEPRATDLNKLISGMSDMLARALGETIRVETVLAGGLWRTSVDPNQLENALLNLAINARDAMLAGGKLTVETANTYLDEHYADAHNEVTPGQYVLIAVSDTGAGMSEEVRARAFEPFYTTKAEGKGTGLGLSQVFGFVKQSGGHIKAYSEVGQGTTIKIYLPRQVSEAAPAPEPARPNVGYLARGETVLLVEDDVDVREYAVYALKSLGYRVLEAPDGPSALRLLDSEANVDLLFTDVVLPDMNGRQLADEARRRLPGLRVLFTSGYTRNAIVHHGQLDPGLALLPKPFTVEGLGRKLRQVLGEAP